MIDEVTEAPATPDTSGPQMPETQTSPALRLAAVAAAAAAAASLAGCGGGGGGKDNPPPTPVAGRTVTLPTAGYSYLTPGDDKEAARFLQHAQCWARDTDIASVRTLGYIPWLQRQIAATYINGWDWLNYQGYGDVTSSNNYYDNTYPCDFMIWGQLMSTTAPVRARMALALSEIFVVSLSSIDADWRSHIVAHYWDTLMRLGLGNYRDLLEAITLNVAMGYFLNTKGNLKENSSGRQPDENYAREVMQLFTIGLQKLNADGTVQVDGSGNPINTYTASDVSNLARVFTGYNLDQRQNQPTTISGRTISSTHFTRLPMIQTQNTRTVSEANHSTLAATFLGVTVPANTPAATALRTALDTLFNHANTAPFICKQLIQRLVTSNPSPAYVQRVAAVFDNNGSGVRGDLAYVLSAILMDSEARSPTGLTAPEHGKLREPMLRLVQWARTFNVNSGSGSWKIQDQSDAGSRLGQSPLRAPSVFNFFRPGYVPPKTGLSTGKVAPEFQLVNETSVGGYLNYIMSVISSGVGDLPSDIRSIYSTEVTLAVSPSAAAPSALVERVNLLLCAGQLSPATVSAITTAVGTMASTSGDNRLNRVYATVLMTMACAEYLIQK